MSKKQKCESSDKAFTYSLELCRGRIGHRPAPAHFSLINEKGTIADRPADLDILFREKHRNTHFLHGLYGYNHLFDNDRRYTF